LILGEEAAAVAASRCLLEQGLWIPAIRPPTVPRGTARLRITLSTAHTDRMIERLKEALATFCG
jgi:8-amino-7-oxononanoate synthase